MPEIAIQLEDREGAPIVVVQVAEEAEAFTESLKAIPQMGDLVLAKVKEMKQLPREVEVTMGFKIGVKGNLKMVEANGEAHLQITLKWAAGADGE